MIIKSNAVAWFIVISFMLFILYMSESLVEGIVSIVVLAFLGIIKWLLN